MKKTKEAGAEETNAERGGMGEGTKWGRERERESRREQLNPARGRRREPPRFHRSLTADSEADG